MTTFTPLTIESLTTATLSGGGVFDVLMRATKAHLESEFKAGHIKGTEYATVYLGSLQAVLQASLQFAIQKESLNLENSIKEKQLALMDAQVRQAEQEILLSGRKLDLMASEIAISQAKLANIPKEGHLLDSQRALTDQQLINLSTEKAGIEAKTTLTINQADNALVEHEVLDATVCKLKGEYDVLIQSKLRSAAETSLLNQKLVTEQAQTTDVAAVNSVLGKQMALYSAQAVGYTKDALQKKGDLYVKAWATARTTDSSATPLTDINSRLDAMGL